MAATVPSSHLVNEEELKEMQKQKEEFETRKASLDDRHHLILNIIEDHFEIKHDILEDFLSEVNQLEPMDSFFQADNLDTLFVYRYKGANLKKYLKKAGFKLYRKYEDEFVSFHDGSHVYRGDAIIFMKTDRSVAITDKNISQEIYFFLFDINTSMLKAYSDLLNEVFIPSITTQESSLGDLDAEGKKNFINFLQDFNSNLETANICVDQRVVLDIDSHNVSMNGMDALTMAANDPESLAKSEEAASRWMKQIQKEITGIELLRVESGIIGPHEEFKFWKKQMTRFNSLVNQLKSRIVTNNLIVLKIAHSKVLDKWIELDQLVTRAFIEGKENTKFLSVIEKYCVPLYHRDINKMIEVMPKLLQALGMIYVYSTYYRTFTNMSQLFVKITNQMISTCKGFITEKNKLTVWEADHDIQINRMESCINLNKVYQDCYHKIRKEMKSENPTRYFDFSEVQIFGNFDLFEKRLLKLIAILTAMKNYSVLKEVVLEGKEPIINRYERITASITSKKYDVLNHRNLSFDKDYEEFQSQIEDLHTNLIHVITQYFHRSKGVLAGLRMQEKLEKISIPELDHFTRYTELFKSFEQEIIAIREQFSDNQENPPLDRDMPYFAGRIAWARNLYLHLEEGMNMFVITCPEVFTIPEGRRIVNMYNTTTESIVHYEITVYHTWKKLISTKLVGMKASIFILTSEEPYGECLCNMDPEVLGVLREISCLDRLGCALTSYPREIYVKNDFLKHRMHKIQLFCLEHKRIMGMVPVEYEKLLLPLTTKIYHEIGKGMTLYDWCCLGVEDYINGLLKMLYNFELLLNRAFDIRDYRINNILTSIAETELFAQPINGEPWELTKFVEHTVEKCCKGSQSMHYLSLSIYEASNDYIDILLEEFDKFVAENDLNHLIVNKGVKDNKSKTSSQPTFAPVRQEGALSSTEKHVIRISNASQDLLRIMDQKTVDSVIKSVRSALDCMWNYLACKEATFAIKDTTFGQIVKAEKVKPNPLIKCHVRILGNKLGIRPSLEDIQTTIKKIVITIQNSMKAVVKWSKKGRRKEFLSAVREEIEKSSQPSIVVKDIDEENGNLDDKNSNKGAQKDNSLIVSVSAVSEGESQSSQASRSKSTKQDELGTLSTLQLEIEEQPENCYYDVKHDREVYRLQSFLQSWMNNMRKILFLPNMHLQEIKSLVEVLNCYSNLWTSNPSEEIAQFMANDPSMYEFQSKFKELDMVQEKLENERAQYVVGPLLIDTSDFKLVALANLKAFKQVYVTGCTDKFVSQIEQIQSQLDEIDRNLGKHITNLDDIAFVMDTLANIREIDIKMDSDIMTAEYAAQTMSKFDIPFPKTTADLVEAVRCNYNRMKENEFQVMDHILSIQGGYKEGLMNNIVQLKTDVDEFIVDYKERGPMRPGLAPVEALDKQILFKNRYDNISRKMESYAKGEILFGLTVSEYPQFLQIGKELDLLQRLYGLYNEVNKTVGGYYEIIWKNVDMEKIATDLQDFQNKCKRLPKALKDWPAYTDLQKTIDDFNEKVPLLEMMTNKAMKARHWQRLADLTNYNFDVDSEMFTLKNMLDAPLLNVKDDVEDICVSAVREKDIEAKLNSVIADWANQDLKLAAFKSRGELLLKGDRVSEVVGLLEDSLMILSSLMSNRYNAPFKKPITEWIQKLTTSSEVLENWMKVQNLWVYLEAVFVGGDIAKQLPQEAKRFQGIDKSYVKVMERARDTPNVVQCCSSDHSLVELLPRLFEQLEICQKSLTGYLEKKRLVFPRFFFVSDPVLLEILGQASDPHSIQAHLLSIFDNTKSVKFDERQYDLILSAFSSENEELKMVKPVKCEGHVESWLGQLLKVAQFSLHTVIQSASFQIQDEELDLVEFLDGNPAQVGLLGIQLLWTRDATEALREARNDAKIMQKTNKAFLSLLNLLIGETTRDLSKYSRTKYETLITIHVHQRDIFDDLCKQGVKTQSDFEWTKQTRFYFMEDVDKCVISITDVDFEYQNEFLGCTERLVITPLTDRCYITIAQALSMSLGAAPAGPAGTGKTETTKDMGRCLGKYVVVFNCSDQMDFRGLGRIFKGLAESGSWGCFDEFNRIELPVLSVAAQQVAIVLQAKKEGKTQFIFTDGDHVELNPEFGLFLTMNPGYAGRQELPENLKINFRSVAMMVPDRQIIIRVKLAACGFIENIILARKFYVLYKLCEEQLTKQVHYDFGLRNILSVLRTLGAARRISPNDSEDKTVMRVLRDMNLSKLVDQDEPLFLSLINDLFPGIVLDKAGYPELESSVKKQVDNLGMINHPPWNLKVIQLFETQRVRHGMMALGPSGAGKSVCISVLMKALTDCGDPHREMRMNPKAITASEMFGKLDVATNDWTDGIFSTLWRRTLKLKKGEHCWLILDGPVDAIWIENLNSVLDDNKTLTLANGDRIPMGPNCKIIFEVHNIDNASPATVSRNGMVFMSSSALNWSPILQGWLLTRPLGERDKLYSFFEKSFPQTYKFVINNLTMKMIVLEAFIIRQACDLLQGMIQQEGLSDKHLERFYVFSLMWSLGAFLELNERAKMEEFLKTGLESKLDLPINEGESTIFEYRVSNDGNWEHWNQYVDEYVYPKDFTPEYSKILVPNVDNIRTEYLIDTISKQAKSVLLIGEQGTAKTVMISKYMGKFNPESHVCKSFNFSSATTPALFQRTMESFVEKRVGTTFGPPAGKKMTVFIDDINMPLINEWGDQIANEIVRQNMEMKGFYSLEKPGEFINIVDVQFVSAMIHPGGGRNDIPERLKRHFNIFNCTLPSNNSIDKVFSVIGLGHYCEERGFKHEIISLVKKLIPLTRALWQNTKGKMLPTPAKFHYVFNLRDLSRIWQGMINTQSDVISSSNLIVSLWKHECMRVISDRFVNPEDEVWFIKTLKRIFSEEISPKYEELLDLETNFVDFLRDPPEPTGEEPEDFDFSPPKIYEPIVGFPELKDRLKSFMTQYNESIRGAGMDLVFFHDCMTHLMKISRIIRTPQGNALLVGVGGSGKQSLTRLATFIAGYKSFQITLTRSYNVTNLLEDLKTLYRSSGQDGKGTTFIFTDNEIKDEGFLEYMNNILASGVVSGLFAKDEMDEIIGNLIPIMKKEFPKRPPSIENLNDYFYSRVRKHLHVVLCFSPVGQKFRKRALYFPGLISGCIIDWFQKWPNDALLAVAEHYLGNFPMVCDSQTKKNIIETVAFIHDDVSNKCSDYFDRYRRVTHVTPKSYLSFLQSYQKVYNEKKDYISELARRMDSGLKKLVEAQESIALLSIELAEKEKELDIANKEAEKVLENVTQQTNAAQIVKDKVQRVKDRCLKIVEGINEDRGYAEAKLEAAKPALQEAEDALNTIKPADISTVRKLAKPPHLIMRIMDCVLLLFQRNLDPVTRDPERPCNKPSWSESLKLMAQTTFLNSLLNFSRDSITEEVVDLLEPYLNMDDYNWDTAKKACGNVAGLLSWTKAMEKFYWVNKEVLPLKDNLAKQEIKLNSANADLEKAEGLLQEKEELLGVVRAQYDAAMKRKQELADDADACRRRMNTAKQLIDGLSGEKLRWTEQSKLFKDQIKRLVGDIIVCTAFLSYTGPFNQDFRMKLMATWNVDLSRKNIPSTHGLDIIKMLADAPTISEWNLQGLPNDELSIQNGIIVTSAARYPLLIDPQGQGKIWIKNREGSKELQITSLNHKYFRQHLEDSLSLGRPMLIEDINEELDPALDNVLEKNFIKMGTGFKVKVGDKEVDLMKGFMLYVTTKLPNPHYTPEIYAKTSVIDFTVTIKGLEDQLLGRVIKTEKEELEKSRIELVENMTNNKRRMQELEDSLLERLANTEGSLVDDQNLLDVLFKSKITSQEVSQQLSQAVETEKEINTAREEYRPVATRGSVLYFLFTEMSNVNRMYQTGLKQFLMLFDQSMTKSDKSPITQRRIAIIIDYMTLEMWRFAVRGMYKEDRMTLTLMLALKIDIQSKNVRQEEFDVLIKGGSMLDLKTVPQKPAKWITDLTWLNLNALSVLIQFSGIVEQVIQSEKQWRQWYDKETPETEVIPGGYDSSLDTFRRLLMVRSWCPDRTLPQARKYIASSLGDRFAEEVLLKMDSLVKESDCRSPLVNLLSMGSDATPLIEQFAKKKNIQCKSVSMGQGQEIHARKLITKFMQEGGWVLLQNCHLCLDYIEELFLQIVETEHVSEKYRLWVTTEEHPKFSINFLQLAVKFTNEPPEGIKANLMRTYNDVTQDFLDTCVTSHWKVMLYGLAFLHCTVQERRKFGPLGWNIPYEYNQSDFNASIQFIQNHLDSLEFKKAQKISGIDWKCVRYMISEIQYGGRVTDDFDKILLVTITRNYFQEKMFQPEFSFFTGYNIPLYTTVQEYWTHISHLPSKDTPEAFGLHPNADITYSTKTTKVILDTILSIQPKDSASGGGETRETVVLRQSADMLAKLPVNYIPYQVQEKLQKLGPLQPMNIFLRQEVDRMNKVIKIVRTTLTDLQLAIHGTIIMNENLRDALDSLFDAKVPSIWFKISWDSATLGFWFSELIDRNNQFSSWLNDGRPNTFWMTGFFNPQGFLTAMRQEVTRSHEGWALDSVVLTSKVTKHSMDEIKESPKEGVFVYGLFVEGAAWDKRNSRLTEPKPKELYDNLPVINIYAMQEAVKNKMDFSRYYTAPIYKKPRRTDLTYVANVELLCSKTPDHWVMRGVALLCDIK